MSTSSKQQRHYSLVSFPCCKMQGSVTMLGPAVGISGAIFQQRFDSFGMPGDGSFMQRGALSVVGPRVGIGASADKLANLC
jgi:hypothetical protein